MSMKGITEGEITEIRRPSGLIVYQLDRRIPKRFKKIFQSREEASQFNAKLTLALPKQKADALAIVKTTDSMTIAAYYRVLFERYSSKAFNRAPSTIIQLESRMRAHVLPAMGALRIIDITRTFVRDLIVRLSTPSPAPRRTSSSAPSFG